MSIIETLRDAKNTFLAKAVSTFSNNPVSDEKKAPAVNWFAQAPHGVPRGINPIELRKYEKSSWVQMVENAICKQLMTVEYKITPKNDEEDIEKYSKDIETAMYLLEHPNRNGQTFWEVWGPWVRDVMSLDAAVIWKGKNTQGQIVELFNYDGSRFLIDMDKHGIINKYWQYSYSNAMGAPNEFEKNEIIYGRMNLSTENYPYGFSPLQSIQQEVELMIQSTRYNKEFFKNNATPSGIVAAQMDADSLKRFQATWENEIKGKAHKLAFINGANVDFKNLSTSNKDMEWLEGQRWYFHLVFGAYGLSPQEVGFYENSNRATGESQERITIKNAIKPYLKLISDKINRELLPELLGHDKLKFEWIIFDAAAEKIEHDQEMQKLQANVYTINEIRIKEGLDPVEWGDKPFAMSMQENSQQNNVEMQDKNKEKDKDKEEDKKKEKKIDYKITKDVSTEMDETQYDKFLKKKFGQWEDAIMAAIDKEIIKSNSIDKSFGNFLARLFNQVNTLTFQKELNGVIKNNMIDGIKDAEKELNVDIGYSIKFDKSIEILTLRQLDGFYIDGSKWDGLKGVAKDLQNDVMHQVSADVINGSSTKEIKANVKEILGKYLGHDGLEGRATAIARTETTRIYNFGKVQAYKESGLKGKKVWDAFIDHKTSDICKELNGQKIDVNADFELRNGERWNMPPAHTNCRSVVRFELD